MIDLKRKCLWRFFAFVFSSSFLSNCLVFPDIVGYGDWIKCECACFTCNDETVPPGGTCPDEDLELDSKERILYFCKGMDVDIDDQDMLDACSEECDKKPSRGFDNLSYGSFCGRNGYFVLHEAGKCPAIADDEFSYVVGDPPYTPLHIDEEQSRIKLTIKGDSSTKHLGGEIGFIGGNCPGWLCDVELHLAILTAPNMEIGGFWPIHVNGFHVISVDIAKGFVYPDGTIVFGPEEIDAIVYMHVYKWRIFDVRYLSPWINEFEVIGFMNYPTKTFELTGTFIEETDEGSVKAEIDLFAKWDNLSPQVSIYVDSNTIECTEPNAGIVNLYGYVFDSDGTIIKTQWVVDRVIVSTELETTQMLSLGKHYITLHAKDDDGAYGQKTIEVTVVDTTSPILGPIEVSPHCASPPNHKYIRLAVGDEIMATVTDECDPNPVVYLEDAWCDELDNGTGDGDTTEDIVLFDDAVCLRSERSGNLDGRVYSVQIGSSDGSGNQSSGFFDVIVAHDQSDHDCTPLPPSTFVSHDDEPILCGSEPDEYVKSSDASDAPGTGCGIGEVSTGGNLSNIMFCLIVLVFGRRRIRRTSKKNSNTIYMNMRQTGLSRSPHC